LWDKDAPFIEEPLYYNPDPATDKDQISIWSNNIFDDKSGIKEVILYYTEPGSSIYNSIQMSKDWLSNKYSATIGPFTRKSGYIKDYIKAIDNYGNVQVSNIYQFRVDLWDNNRRTI
ncbi:MAG: hypothetical protein ACTSRZ_15240, partial [Promethearchaeota archaeon]